MVTKIKPPEPGLYYDVPMSTYLSWDAFSKSDVQHILRSPAHFVYNREHPMVQSESMKMGSLVDCLLLEPERQHEYFAMLPNTYLATDGTQKPFNRNSTTCKQIEREINESGKTIVTEDQVLTAEAIKVSIESHQSAQELLQSAKTQVSVVWIDEETKVVCKGRYDAITENEIIDLKTTQNASAPEFRRTMQKFLYHVQAAMYSDSYASLTKNIQLPFIFIVAETSAPYGVATYATEPDSLLTGRHIYKKALKIYADCQDTGSWYAYSQFVEPIEIPAYAISKVMEEGIIDGTGF